MQALSDKPNRNARDSKAEIFVRLRSIGQRVFAERINKGESTVSEWTKNGHFEAIVNELDALDLKVVHVDSKMCGENESPIPNEISLTALIMLKAANGNGPLIVALEKALIRRGAIKRTPSGDYILPKSAFDGIMK